MHVIKPRSFTYFLCLGAFCCATFFLIGCSTAKPHSINPLTGGHSTSKLETLSTNFQLSFRSEEKHGSVRGMLAYKQPDQLRLVLLNPFGTVAMEVLMQQETLTVLYPENGVAFHGPLSQLSSKIGRRGWGLLRWMLENVPPEKGNGTYERVVDAKAEMVTVQDGVVIEKRRSSGEQVSYQDYVLVSGVMLAQEQSLQSVDGNRIKILLEEPEVNQLLSEQALMVNLAGVQLLPITALKDENF